MVSKDEFQQELQRIEREFTKKVVEYSRKISYRKDVLEMYRRDIRKNDFPDMASEVLFFKEQKQIPQIHLVYFLNLREYELEKQGLMAPFLIKYINDKIRGVSKFLSLHLEFIRYIELEQIDLDDHYFSRRFQDKGLSNRRIYFRDPGFSTSHDLLLSEIKANQLYLEFLQSELGRQNNPSSIKSPNAKFQWTSSKAALVELLYALYYAGSINNGNISLKEFMIGMEEFFGVELGNYHHKFLRLRERSNPFQFLEKLRKILFGRIEELDD